MRRIRIGIIGAGAATEWSILPVLSGPDIVAPPDTGAWWGRRAPSTSDIYYQAPARPEVVALSDEDGARAERVAHLSRVRGVYSDWRSMLREVELDAVLCTASPHVAAEVAVAAGAAVKWLWLAGTSRRFRDGSVATGARLTGDARCACGARGRCVVRRRIEVHGD
jgi:predicted dehydrogenase